MPKHNFKVGDLVRHKERPEFGVGKILSATVLDDKLGIEFENPTGEGYGENVGGKLGHCWQSNYYDLFEKVEEAQEEILDRPMTAPFRGWMVKQDLVLRIVDGGQGHDHLVVYQNNKPLYYLHLDLDKANQWEISEETWGNEKP